MGSYSESREYLDPSSESEKDNFDWDDGELAGDKFYGASPLGAHDTMQMDGLDGATGDCDDTNQEEETMQPMRTMARKMTTSRMEKHWPPIPRNRKGQWPSRIIPRSRRSRPRALSSRPRRPIRPYRVPAAEDPWLQQAAQAFGRRRYQVLAGWCTRRS
jgi:hypothetical protein